MSALKIDKKVSSEIIWLMTQLITEETTISIMNRETQLKFVSKCLNRFDETGTVFYLPVPKNTELLQFQEALRKNPSLVGTINRQGILYGLHFNFIRLENHTLVCSMPSELYEINRRRHHRHKLQASEKKSVLLRIKANVGFGEALNQVNIFDIASQGLSFTIDPAIAPYFKKEQVLKNCLLSIYGSSFDLNLTIRNMFAQKDGTLKVGVSIENPTPALMGAIQVFILRQEKYE